MRLIRLDATKWRLEDDIWPDLLRALEAPDWHGHNLDALWDTIREGASQMPEGHYINGLQPPFHIEVTGLDRAPREVRLLLGRIRSVIDEARKELGMPVSMKLRWRSRSGDAEEP